MCVCSRMIESCACGCVTYVCDRVCVHILFVSSASVCACVSRMCVRRMCVSHHVCE